MALQDKQIFTLVNDAAYEALGNKDITAKDTGSLVSLGDKILSSETDTEAFYKSLTNRIGRTVIAVRAFEIENRSVMRDEMEWGIVYQKISYRMRNAVENPSWNTNNSDPFDVVPQTEVVQKLFSVLGTFSYEDSIPDYQLFTAFTSESTMGAFISGIYTNMYNAMKLAEANTANLAVNTYMAGALTSGKKPMARNLLAEYMALGNKPAFNSIDAAMRDAEFLKFATKEINDTVKQMQAPSMLFNAEGIARQTTKDKMVVEVLGKFASATASYLEADTYHNELVKLPRYEEVAYWQAPGPEFRFETASEIDVQHKNVNDGKAVNQRGIIAFVHDYDAVASVMYRRRSRSIYNPRAERFNIFEKADKGYAVDLSENGVVFYVSLTDSGYRPDDGGHYPDDGGGHIPEGPDDGGNTRWLDPFGTVADYNLKAFQPLKTNIAASHTIEDGNDFRLPTVIANCIFCQDYAKDFVLNKETIFKFDEHGVSSTSDKFRLLVSNEPYLVNDSPEGKTITAWTYTPVYDSDGIDQFGMKRNGTDTDGVFWRDKINEILARVYHIK